MTATEKPGREENAIEFHKVVLISRAHTEVDFDNLSPSAYCVTENSLKVVLPQCKNL